MKIKILYISRYVFVTVITNGLVLSTKMKSGDCKFCRSFRLCIIKNSPNKVAFEFIFVGELVTLLVILSWGCNEKYKNLFLCIVDASIYVAVMLWTSSIQILYTFSMTGF